MKRILAGLILFALAAVSAQAQGTINFLTGAAAIARISTNSVISGPATGLISTNGGACYYFALYYSPTATSVSGTTAAISGLDYNNDYAPFDSNWTFAGYGTNSTVGRMVGGTFVISNVPSGSTAQFVAIGWSANIGPTVSSLQSWLSNPIAGGWVGQSAVTGPLMLGGGAYATPTMFGSVNGQVAGFTLGITSDYIPPSGSAPYITSQPTNLTVAVGASASFAVAATGSPAPSYQWTFNGTNITGANGQTFNLSNVQLTNAGAYAVKISNSSGSTNSATASLTVQTPAMPPYITAQPANLTVLAGSGATFSVNVSGTQPINYQWGFNGTNIDGATSASLVLANIQATNVGQYQVAISNLYGSTNSSIATLSVAPNGGNVLFTTGAGAIARMSTNAAVNGPSAGLTGTNLNQYYYALYYSSTATSVNGQTTPLCGNTNSSYAFNDSNWTLAGYGTNAAIAGRMYGVGPGVNGAVVITNIPSGSTAQFVVIGWSANIGPDLGSVQTWFNSGCSAPGWIGQSAVSGPIILGDGITIALMSPLGAASNQVAGFTLGLTGTALTTPAPPLITSQPAGLAATVGDNVTFYVAATGNPLPACQWMFDGTNIAGATGYSLKLSNVQLTNSGSYSAYLTNASGSTNSYAAVLTVSTAPGYVVFANTAASSTKIFTNSATGGPSTGLTGTNGLIYRYALFASATATTVIGQSSPIVGAANANYAFNDPNWTLVAYGTNSSFIRGRFYSANNNYAGLTPVSGFPGGTYAQFVVIGWSASIGADIPSVQTWFNNGYPASDGWIGQSAVSGPIVPGDNATIPAPAIFGAFYPYLPGFTLGLASPNSSASYVVPYSPPAILQSRLNNGSLQLSWSNSAGAFGVQWSGSPIGPWTDLNATITTDGTYSSVIVPAGKGPFFRLIVQ